MSENLPVNANAERLLDTEFTPEDDSTQAAYVAAIFEHVRTIPASFPRFYYPSGEEATFMSRYCTSGDYTQRYIIEAGKPQLFHKDIIDPEFCESTHILTAAIAGAKKEHHWYGVDGRTPYGAPAQDHLSRQWDMFFIPYMRQRHLAQAHFLRSILPDQQNTYTPYLRAVAQLGPPPRKPFTSEVEPLPDALYNVTNWVTGSLLSTLALPPEKCSAAMKRRALELFAAHATQEDLEVPRERGNRIDTSPVGSYALSGQKASGGGLLRLPWSMQQTHQELTAASHPHWQGNSVIKQYFGTPHAPRADALASLLQERPKDYVQVLLLRIFSEYVQPSHLRDLASTVQLSEPVKDIIFSEDAAFNTVFCMPRSRQQMADQQLGLNDLLAGTEARDDPETLRATVGRQALQIKGLQSDLAERNLAFAQLSERHQQLLDEIRRGYVTSNEIFTQSPEELLFDKHGMSIRVGACACALFVKALREKYARHYGPAGPETNPEKLERLGRELDTILALKGAEEERTLE